MIAGSAAAARLCASPRRFRPAVLALASADDDAAVRLLDSVRLRERLGVMALVSRDETVEERVLPPELPPLLDNELAGLAEVLEAPDEPFDTGLDEDALLGVDALVDDDDDGLETVPVAFSAMVDPAEVLDAPDPPLASLLAMLVS
jgi:hypothetical protein